MTRGGKKYKKKDKDTRRRQDGDKRDREDNSEGQELHYQEDAQVEDLASYFKNDDVQALRKVFMNQNIEFNDDLSEVPPLLGGVILGKFDVVKRLLRLGHPIDCLGPGQSTPLMWAVRNNSMEMIDLLLKRGSNVSLQDVDGNNAIILAPQISGWSQESFLDFWNSVKDNENFDVNHANKTGITILHYAAKKEWEVFLESLLLLERKVHIDCVTQRGVTPLMLAGSENLSGVVKLLIKSGADVTIEDERGCTVLCYAIAYMIQKGRRTSTVELLVNAFNDAMMTMGTYLKRRLQLMVSPPTLLPRFTETVANVLTGVISFFLRYIESGVTTLLHLQVFTHLVDAARRHLTDAGYCHAVLGVLFELVRFCSCCLGRGDNPAMADRLVEAFVAAGAADVCLTILNTHGSTNEILLCAGLMPLFAACGSLCTAGVNWLVDNYEVIIPFHARFLQLYMVSCNLCNADNHHLRLVKYRIATFKSIMNNLLIKGHIIAKTEQNTNGDEKAAQLSQIPQSEHETEDLTSNKRMLDEPVVEKQPQGVVSTKRGRRKAAKAFKLKLAKKRGMEMVAHCLKATDAITPGQVSPKFEDVLDENFDSKQGNTSDVLVSNDCVLITHPEQNVSCDGETNNWVALWDKTFYTTDSSLNKDDTSCDESTSENLKVQEMNPSIPQSFNHEQTELSNDKYNSKLIDSNPVVNGDEEEQFNCVLLDAAEERTEDQSSTLSRTSDDLEMSDGREDVSLSGDGSKFDQKNRTNPHPNKTSCFDQKFQDILTKYMGIWHWERENDYPGHQVYFYDKEVKTQKDFNILVLKKILPGLEQEFIQRLESRWQSLTSKLQRAGDDKFDKITERLVSLLDCFSSELDKKLGSIKHFDDQIRNPSCNMENEWTHSDMEYTDKKVRIVGVGYQHQRQHPFQILRNNTQDNLQSQRKLCQLYELESQDNTGGVTRKNFHRMDDCVPANNNFYLDISFSAALKRPKMNSKQEMKDTIAEVEAMSFQCFPNGLSCSNLIGVDAQGFTRQYHESYVPDHVPGGDCHCTDMPCVSGCRATLTTDTVPFLSPPPGFQGHTTYRAVNLSSDTELVSTIRGSQNVGEGLWRNINTFYSRGSFGTSELWLDGSEHTVTVKKIAFFNYDQIAYMKEILNYLTKLRHQNIANYYSFWQQNNMLFMTSPMQQYNLEEYLEALKKHDWVKSRANDLMRQLCCGLHYLHTFPDPIVHGNLKPTNILITKQGLVKLADFGFNQIQHTMNMPEAVAMIWWANESIGSFQHTGCVKWNMKTDIHVAGMLFHYIETGRVHPFGSAVMEIMGNILHGRPVLQLEDEAVEDLVLTMIQLDASMRPSVMEVLRHAIFWDDVKKWKLILACCGIVSHCRHLPLYYMKDLYSFLDKKTIHKTTYCDWKMVVRTKLPEMGPFYESLSSTSISGLLKCIRVCVEQNKEPTRFTTPLHSVFLTAFPSLPMTLFRIIKNTDWMHHYALDKFKP